MKLQSIVAISLVCLVGCKSKKAMDYNNLIVKKQKSLAAAMDATEPQLKNYFANYQYDSIVNVSTRMESRIDSILVDLQRKPAPNAKQGDNFKKAALNYFNFMKSKYTSYKNYGLQTTPQGRMFQLQVMNGMTNQEDKAVADMQQAQRIFAKDNGFKISEEKKSDNRSLTASPSNER